MRYKATSGDFCLGFAASLPIYRFLLDLIGRLSVSRKLMLIYALELSAVIFVSTILINEKFIAIDFARKEIVGNEYIAAVRAASLGAVDSGQAGSAAADVLAAEARYGSALNDLLHTRIDGLFERMWLHLGTAVALLLVILSVVFFVARQIALPMQRLAKVADDVRNSCDYPRFLCWTRSSVGLPGCLARREEAHGHSLQRRATRPDCPAGPQSDA